MGLTQKKVFACVFRLRALRVFPVDVKKPFSGDPGGVPFFGSMGGVAVVALDVCRVRFAGSAFRFRAAAVAWCGRFFLILFAAVFALILTRFAGAFLRPIPCKY